MHASKPRTCTERKTMKSFDPETSPNETEKLIDELHENLIYQVRKYMNKCNDKPTKIVLCALQGAMINVTAAVTASCAESAGALNNKLDYIEAVRYDMDQALNIIRKELKNNVLK